MPDVTVYNLGTSPLTIPGGYYTSTIAPNRSATFSVPDIDEFAEEARIKSLVDGSHIRLEYTSGGMAYNRQLVVYGGGGTSTTATVMGVLVSDLILATVNASTNPSYIVSAECTATNTVTLTFSANPGANTTVALLVYR